MKSLHKLAWLLIIIVSVFCAGIIVFSFFYTQYTGVNSANYLEDGKATNRMIPAEIISTNISLQARTIFINITVPEVPASIPIYRATVRNGDVLYKRFGNTMSPKHNVTSEQDAPEVAKRVMEQYGGLPSDAVYVWSETSYLETQTDTGEVLYKEPVTTSVAYGRMINGLSLDGDTDYIRLELGENGEPLEIRKIWRTISFTGNASIIPVDDAITKLENGDTIEATRLPNKYNISIHIIRFRYYQLGNGDTILEPVWIFLGQTEPGDQSVKYIVYARQFANFTATPTSGKTPLTVSFSDTSDASPTKWYWNFGDDTNSIEQNPAHTYTTAGSYNVSLRAWNDLGSDTMEKVGYIPVRNPAPPIANFTATLTSGKAPLAVQFTDLSANGPLAWAWSFGDGYVSMEQNPVHRYDVSGTYAVALDATNADGSDTKTRTDYITVINPDNPTDLIDQLIIYINNQNNVPKMFRLMWTGQLKEVKRFLDNDNPSDAVVWMKYFKLSVGYFKGWIITNDQAATMQNSADAIIRGINLPVNQQAIDQTKSLAADVKNLKLPAYVEHPLTVELEGTLFTLECAKDQAAVSYLNMFISSVKAQDGRTIPHDKAVRLIAKAEGIKKII